MGLDEAYGSMNGVCEGESGVYSGSAETNVSLYFQACVNIFLALVMLVDCLVVIIGNTLFYIAIRQTWASDKQVVKLLPVITLQAYLTHCGRVTQICGFNTVKLGTSASSP